MSKIVFIFVITATVRSSLSHSFQYCIDLNRKSHLSLPPPTPIPRRARRVTLLRVYHVLMPLLIVKVVIPHAETWHATAVGEFQRCNGLCTFALTLTCTIKMEFGDAGVDVGFEGELVPTF